MKEDPCYIIIAYRKFEFYCYLVETVSEFKYYTFR